MLGVTGRGCVHLLFALSALGLAACDNVEERASKHLARGEALMAQGELEKARIEFRNALRLDDNNAVAHFKFAELLEQKGDLRSALRNYVAVTELDSQHVEARIKAAQFYLMGQAPDEAQRFAAEAYALAPGNPDVLALRGNVAYQLGNLSEARESANAAIAVDPDHVGAHTVLIMDAAQHGAPEEALAHADRVLARVGNNETLDLLKLRILGQMERNGDAEAQLVHMAEAYPSRPNYRRALFQAYAARRDLAAAEKQLRALVEISGGTPASHLEIVQFRLVTAGPDSARQELQDLIAGAEGEALVTYRLAMGNLEGSVGNTEAARAIFEDIIGQGGDDADRARVQLARLDYAAKDLQEALTQVGAVLEHDASNVEALVIRATIAIDQDRPEDAINDARAALAVDPRNVNLMLLEARAHERNGNPTLVGERLASATRVSEFTPDVAMLYARYLSGHDQLVAAEAVLNESSRRNPRSVEVLTALAELRLRLNDLTGAEAVAEQLRAINNGEITSDQIKAAVLTRSGRIEDSIDLLESTVSQDQPEGAALIALISNYIQAGEGERAKTFLDDLIARNPDNIRAIALRGELHMRDGETQQAQDLLKRVVEVRPGDAQGYMLLFRFHMALRDRDAAEAVLRQGLEGLPDNQLMRSALAELLEQKGSYEEAIAEYQTLYSQNPNSLLVVNNLTSLIAEFKYGDAEALAFATRIARRLRGSTIPQFLDTYGWLQFLSGDYEEALRSLKPAAEGLPNNPFVRYHIGRAYAALDQNDQARENLEAALAIDPNFAKAGSARTALDRLAGSGG